MMHWQQGVSYQEYCLLKVLAREDLMVFLVFGGETRREV
jgi:hypothetical protein